MSSVTADPFSKMEYGDTAAANRLNAIYTANPSLFTTASGDIDDNAINCTVSTPVNFLYLSTIRGGRKMNEEVTVTTGGGCGCGKMGGGGGEGEGSESSESGREYVGGCFTCKKGVKNIIHIYSSVHIIIPKLYSKYKNKERVSLKSLKVKPMVKPKVKPIKKAATKN
jgi:hypothetical protein